MRIVHGTLLFVGVSLATAGIVMLIGLGDTTARDVIGEAVRFWPIAVIALGAGLLVRQTRYALVGTLVAATLAGFVFGGAVVAARDAYDSLCTDGVAPAAAQRFAHELETLDHRTAWHPAELDRSAWAGSVVLNPAGGCK